MAPTMFGALASFSPALASASEATTSMVHGEFLASAGTFMALIMFLVIVLVATEKVHRTLVVFFIASALIFLTHVFGTFIPGLQFLTLDQAFASIDWEVIALLFSMMIVVWVMAQTRVFEWLAAKLFKISNGNLMAVFFLFIFITAIVSAILDNVTTMFLITPVAISIAKVFKINPITLVVPMIIFSNIWGAATLIWDPPNIMIWSYAGLSFNEFLANMGIPVFFIMIIIAIKFYFMYRGELGKHKKIKNFDKVCKEMEKEYKIRHKKLLKASMLCLAFIVVFFFLHHNFHMPAAVPALMGAALLMLARDRLIRRKFGRSKKSRELMEEKVHETFSHDVEWLVLGFFIFLFMIVGAVEHTGILDQVAILIQHYFGDNLLLCALSILWISAIFSAFLDNIPFTAVMLPVVWNLVAYYAGLGVDATFLWWSLAFWACLGGNGTIIGASANIVAAGILDKHKHHLSFMEYFKVAFPSMIVQVCLASVAVYWMFTKVVIPA